MFGQGLQPLVGGFGAQFAFKAEWTGDDGHRHDSQFTGYFGHDRGGAGTGAAAHAGGNKAQIRAIQLGADLVQAFFGGLPANLGLGSGTQAPGQYLAQLQGVDLALLQRLGVGIHGHDMNVLGQSAIGQQVDGVATATADADDADINGITIRFGRFKIEVAHPVLREKTKGPNQSAP